MVLKKILERCFVVCAALSLFFSPAVLFPEEKKPGPEEHNRIHKILFFTQTKSCACTKRRIEKAERILRQTMKRLEYDIPREVINIQVDVILAEKWERKVGWNFMPVILFLDRDGKVLKKLEANIGEDDISAVIEEYRLEPGGEQPQKEES